jgi:hypothetical protein
MDTQQPFTPILIICAVVGRLSFYILQYKPFFVPYNPALGGLNQPFGSLTEMEAGCLICRGTSYETFVSGTSGDLIDSVVLQEQHEDNFRLFRSSQQKFRELSYRTKDFELLAESLEILKLISVIHLFPVVLISLSIVHPKVAVLVAPTFTRQFVAYLFYFAHGGDNVFSPEHPDYCFIRKKISLYKEHISNPLFVDRVQQRPDLQKVCRASHNRYLSVDQKCFLYRLDYYLRHAENHIFLKVLSEHKGFLMDWDYPGRKNHPGYAD